MPEPIGIDEKPIPVPWWRRFVGPILTLLMVAGLITLHQLDSALVNPGIPLIVVVAIGAYVGGFLPGLVCAAFALVFLGAYVTPADQPYRIDLLAPAEQARIGILASGIAVMALLGGTARRRIRHASRAQRRRQRAYSRGLMASIQDGLQVTAPDGRIMEDQPAVQRADRLHPRGPRRGAATVPVLARVGAAAPGRHAAAGAERRTAGGRHAVPPPRRPARPSDPDAGAFPRHRGPRDRRRLDDQGRGRATTRAGSAR